MCIRPTIVFLSVLYTICSCSYLYVMRLSVCLCMYIQGSYIVSNFHSLSKGSCYTSLPVSNCRSYVDSLGASRVLCDTL